MQKETTEYCKSKCNNVIIPKNNVNSPGFLNISTKVRQSLLLASKAPSVTSGVTIYGNLLPGGGQQTYVSPNAYYNGIVNGKVENNSIQQYYVKQSLGLLLKMKR